MMRSPGAANYHWSMVRSLFTSWIVVAAMVVDADTGAPPFSVALWGDMPYLGTADNVFDVNDPVLLGTVSVGVVYNNLRDSINSAKTSSNDDNDINATITTMQFSFHVGDVKLDASPCYEDKWFTRFETLANSLSVPVFLALGDNDWTDCYGDFDWANFRFVTQASSLQYVRERFYRYDSNNNGRPILGSNTDSWSLDVTTGGSEYPELQRFIYQDIMFVVLHVVGSNNNRRSTCFAWDSEVGCFGDWALFLTDFCCCNARAEHTQRNAKVNAYLTDSFQAASTANAKGVMVLGQAHIVNFDDPAAALFGDGFNDFWPTLTAETLSFGKPVAYVHGDSHYFREYMPDAVGVPNLQAVMVPGKDSIGWVKAVIDGDASRVFSFTHVDVTPNGYTPEIAADIAEGLPSSDR